MKKRETKQVITGVTAEQYQEAMSIYAQNDANADNLIAKMNAELTRVREKYDGDIVNCMEEKERQSGVILAYCTENKDKLFSGRRHIENAHGKVGFRLGTPKLKTLPKWTWDRVLDKVRTVLPAYVRTYQEVDKESLIAARTDIEVAPLLNDIGVYVTQDESFYIELKKEEQPA